MLLTAYWVLYPWINRIFHHLDAAVSGQMRVSAPVVNSVLFVQIYTHRPNVAFDSKIMCLSRYLYIIVECEV